MKATVARMPPTAIMVWRWAVSALKPSMTACSSADLSAWDDSADPADSVDSGAAYWTARADTAPAADAGADAEGGGAPARFTGRGGGGSADRSSHTESKSVDDPMARAGRVCHEHIPFFFVPVIGGF